MSYHQFKSEDGEYGSFEVFYADAGELEFKFSEPNAEPSEAGYYWWACFPGCMPDGEPCGPFETEQEAIDDAQQQ